MDYSPWNSPGQNIGVGSLSVSPGDLPNPGIESRSPALRADSLQAEPQGKFNFTLILELFNTLKKFFFWLCWIFITACGLSLVALSGAIL